MFMGKVQRSPHFRRVLLGEAPGALGNGVRAQLGYLLLSVVPELRRGLCCRRPCLRTSLQALLVSAQRTSSVYQMRSALHIQSLDMSMQCMCFSWRWALSWRQPHPCQW